MRQLSEVCKWNFQREKCKSYENIRVKCKTCNIFYRRAKKNIRIKYFYLHRSIIKIRDINRGKERRKRDGKWDN